MREPTVHEILGEATENDIIGILALLPDDIDLVAPPREGIVLASCREGLGQVFHLGEVLVSESRVRHRGKEGYSVVLGGDPRRALAAAAIEALRAHPEPDGALPAIERLVERARRVLLGGREETTLMVASTRVEFDLLPGA